MNLSSTFRNVAIQRKKTGVLSQITTDYKSRKRKNDKKDTMKLAFTFRNAAIRGKNNGHLLFDDW